MASTAAINMPSQVFLPSFIPASAAAQPPNSKPEQHDDSLDFDLLAEYLLDGGDAGYSDNFIFDFGNESPPTSDGNQTAEHLSIVSPDLQSTPMLSDPLMDNNILTGMSTIQALPATTQIQTIPLTHLPTLPVPVALPATLAPTPPVPMAAPPILTGIAPSPGAPKQLIVHQHKRQRIEPNIQQVPIQVAVAAKAPNAHLARIAAAGAIATPQIATIHKSGRQKSQAQIDRRRERNRILARRTRLRKKFFFESLQTEVMELQRENMALKDIVRSKMDATKSKTILAECKANERLPDVVLEHCGDPSALGSQDFNLMASIKASQQSFVITDPSLQDNPIVYASDGFLTLTGYNRDQVLGRNCRFLQGEESNQTKVASIRKAVTNGDDATITFINYMADGTPFWNKLFVAALRDAQNNIVNYIGVSVKVAGPEQEDIEHGKLLPGQSSSDSLSGENDNDLFVENADTDVNNTVDADAAIMAIEGAVTKAVAAAPNVSSVPKTLP
eukprot:201434_1